MLADADANAKNEEEAEIDFNQGQEEQAIEEPAADDLEMFDIEQLFEE